MTLEKVTKEQPWYFTKENKRFFGDISYHVFHSLKGIAYFVTKTYQWSDMLGDTKKAVFIIHNLNQETGKLGNFVESDGIVIVLETLTDVLNFIEER